jgi:hypothetical protein
MKVITTYEAFDGKTFSDEAACAEYEASRPEYRLAGLTVEQVAAALARVGAAGTALADAIEVAAYRISKLRRESGELKRVRKTAEAPAAAADSAAPAAAEPDWQALLETFKRDLARYNDLEEMDAYVDAERKAWVDGAPAMMRHYAEEAYTSASRALCGREIMTPPSPVGIDCPF